MMAYAAYQITISVKSAGAPAILTSVDQRDWVAVPSIFFCPLDSVCLYLKSRLMSGQ
jgi:hypothetical protein